MRSVIVHLDGCTEADAADLLDIVYPEQRHPWVDFVERDACLYIDFYRHHYYGIEFDPEVLVELKSRFHGQLPLGIIANVSGRHDGTQQVLRFVRTLLMWRTGVATDDYTDHLWSLTEIEAEARYDGLAFFDYDGYSKRYDSGRKSRD